MFAAWSVLMTAALPRARYDLISISLHWLMALGMLASVCLGLSMVEMPLSPAKLKYYAWHKWLGVSLFLCALLRLAWRWRRPVQRVPAAPRQRAMALWVHRVLYGLMFAVPLSGWLMSSAKGVPTVYLGLWQLPDLLARDVELGRRLLGLHQALNAALAVLVLGHVTAALKHHWLDRDDALRRMWPGAALREETLS